MSLASDLLEQARHLASLERGRPKQASLRRAISSAYYSMFHLIVDEAVRGLVSTASLRAAVARSFEHRTLRTAAKAIEEAHRGGNHWIAAYLRTPISRDLVLVCDTFVGLQVQRHVADYDPAASFTRGAVQSRLNIVGSAHTSWARERRSHNARVFMLAAAGLIGQR